MAEIGRKRIVVASDHAGVELKSVLVDHLKRLGHEVSDEGPSDETSVDYPDFAGLVCRAILGGRSDVGLLLCGSGIGMSMTANKFPGIRAALCCCVERARLSRAHNDANVLVLGARFLEEGEATAMLDAWLATPFEGGRHQGRVNKIEEVPHAHETS